MAVPASKVSKNGLFETIAKSNGSSLRNGPLNKVVPINSLKTAKSPDSNKKSQTKQKKGEDNEIPARKVSIERNVLFSDDFDLQEEIGRGRFGIVYRCSAKQDRGEKAAKFVKTLKNTDKQQVYSEIEIMNRLRHKRLLQLEAAYETRREIVLVTEYISGGELFEKIVADDVLLTEAECRKYMLQISEGVAYMHRSHVVHLDLKPENILCKSKDTYDIKIIDFGLAHIWDPTGPPLRVLFGTPEFVAPEVIGYEPIDTKADMWSVGVICFVLLSGLSPFMGDNDIQTFANVTRVDYNFDDDVFDNISDTAKDFIARLLVKRTDKRMSADDCLSHSWLKGGEQAGGDQRNVPLSTEKLKKFLIRRKWQKTGTAIRALGRLQHLTSAQKRLSAAKNSAKTANGGLVAKLAAKK